MYNTETSQSQLKDLVHNRNQKLEQINKLQEEVEELEDQIEKMFQDRIKDRGETTIKEGGYKITVKYPVNVKWDEKQLNEIAEKIRAHGDDPTRYIRFKPQITQTAYNKFPQPIQQVFQPARSTSIGKRKIEIKEDK